MSSLKTLLALAALPALLPAQWPSHPGARVPRGPDGKPKLDAVDLRLTKVAFDDADTQHLIVSNRALHR